MLVAIKTRNQWLVRFDPYIVTVKQWYIVSQIDVTQLTLTLKMTTAQVVETSVTVNNNSPIQDYVHPDDQTQPFEMTPGFKPFIDSNKWIKITYFIDAWVFWNQEIFGAA